MAASNDPSTIRQYRDPSGKQASDTRSGCLSRRLDSKHGDRDADLAARYGTCAFAAKLDSCMRRASCWSVANRWATLPTSCSAGRTVSCYVVPGGPMPSEGVAITSTPDFRLTPVGVGRWNVPQKTPRAPSRRANEQLSRFPLDGRFMMALEPLPSTVRVASSAPVIRSLGRLHPTSGTAQPPEPRTFRSPSPDPRCQSPR